MYAQHVVTSGFLVCCLIAMMLVTNNWLIIKH